MPLKYWIAVLHGNTDTVVWINSTAITKKTWCIATENKKKKVTKWEILYNRKTNWEITLDEIIKNHMNYMYHFNLCFRKNYSKEAN